ncbi:aminotransferase class I/II-fold pyridoxal phosphate-dependent enzyme [Tannerella forsythia]|uniref:aminotransferase class I/II-fold pyridoxal phosphate-dependent enzyme n=2 Tax=Bacteroidales TaxID=171549 RepID=UPI001E536571|nr:aminotransferase class I/II-fold pyridoxal phosphate-dependent enzyme [Tannerella forsythia]
MSKIMDFKQEMQSHEDANLNVYKKHPTVTACDRKVVIYNRFSKKEEIKISFGSNSYLGASNWKRAKKEASEVLLRYGIGTGSVPLLTGTTTYQNELESCISKFTHFQDTILFSSGYTANLGVISGLMRPNNLIIHDKLNHASLIDGTILSGANMLRYRHNDMADLERLLEANYAKYPNGIIVATDGVFSMDGDIAKIPEILGLVKKYNAILLIDEAHAIGVIGKNGAGSLSHYGIDERENIIQTGTLSKAIGTVGGYISASQDIINYLRIYSRSNMFSTSLPPSVCASAIEVLKEMQETDIVMQLQTNAEYMRMLLKNKGFNILQSETPIIPLIVGNSELLTTLVNDAFNAGFLVNAIYPPAVPPKLTRFRISVMATHTKEDIDSFVDTLSRLFSQYEQKTFIE